MIRALYITGICDFGATYTYLGDPRTAEKLLSDLPDISERVIALWQSDPVIPNLNISLHPDVSDATREQIVTSFLVLVRTPEGKQALSNINGYQIEDLMIIDDTMYDDLRDILAGVDVDYPGNLGY